MSKVQYSTISYTVGWLPSSIGFTEQAKTVMAQELNIDKRIIRGSYAVMGASKEPLIKEGAALKKMLSIIRDEFTIPEYTIVQASMDMQQTRSSKIKGSYLIENVRIEEFINKFHDARMSYLHWGERLAEPENYERLKEQDRIALGKDWELVATKYPTAAQLKDYIQCDVPKIMLYDVEFNLEDVAPSTTAMLKQMAQARLEASIDGALFEFIEELKQMISSVAKNCGKRIRVMPIENSKYGEFRNAEVQHIYRHEDDCSIPLHMMVVTLQPSKEVDGKFSQLGKPVEISLSNDEYINILRPYETTESKQLTTSGFENLMFLTNKIQNVKSMLKDDSGKFLDLVNEIQNTLTSFGKSSADITKELKSSDYVRSAAKTAFTELHTKVLATEIDIKSLKQVPRRRIR
jgi:hypothetical protein